MLSINRVQRNGQLNLKDVKPGVKVIIKNDQHPTRHEEITFASLPVFKTAVNGGEPYMWVQIETEYTYPNADLRSLADMGIVPYNDGQWNQWYYTVLAPVPVWGPGLYYHLGEHYQCTVGENLKVRVAPGGHRCSTHTTIEIQVGRSESCGCVHYGEPRAVTLLGTQYTDIAEGVQAKKNGAGISVRQLQK